MLYPDDRTFEGKELRLKQQHFFVSATIQVLPPPSPVRRPARRSCRRRQWCSSPIELIPAAATFKIAASVSDELVRPARSQLLFERTSLRPCQARGAPAWAAGA